MMGCQASTRKLLWRAIRIEASIADLLQERAWASASTPAQR
jgi:hypothetical protein